jgi:rubrerythrin
MYSPYTYTYASYPAVRNPAMPAPAPSAHFQDGSQFLQDLRESINDEVSAMLFYAKLYHTETDHKKRSYIKSAYDDEQKHVYNFIRLYHSLTGTAPVVQPTEIQFGSYKEGIFQAFDRELEAYEKYRDMLLATSSPEVWRVLFEAMTDEAEHAQKFSFIYHTM